MSAVMLSATAACATASGQSQQAPTEVTLAGVGNLPAGVEPTENVTTTAVVTTTTTTTLDTDRFAAAGNRLLVIGDSILASTAKRYTNDMCEALVPLGWRVELNAETNRFVDFGSQVLSRRLDAGWDAAVIMLGNNYNGDALAYGRELERIIERLSPRPVVLLTVTEFRDDRREVNDVISLMAATHEQVFVADWATVTASDDDLVGFDGLHLTDLGRQQIAALVAASVGRAPERPGRCLDSNYTDDSEGSVDGEGDEGSTETTATKSTAPKTTVPRSTVPRTTQPPSTPPPTDPPPTDPPPTDPPPTDPPEG
jgi:lysophospholipase L1-like esterase